MDVRLQNILTGEYLERSEVNWKNLDAKSKEQYRVLADNEAIETRTVYIPPELLEAQEKETGKAEDVTVKVDGKTISASAEVTITDSTEANKEETPEEKVIRLHKAGGAKKDIVNATGLHHKTVQAIIDKSEAK